MQDEAQGKTEPSTEPSTEPVPAAPAGLPFGPFLLMQELGRGGMGVVWKAWDLRLRRVVALKQVHSDAPTAIERFEREARLAARLRHPNILPIHEVGVQGGRHYFTTDFVVARPMDALLAEGASTRTAIGWIRTIASALHYAHGQGVLHRDVKPANILIDAEGRPYLTDFGVAKETALEALPGKQGTTLTATGSLVGSPQYMSPEQASGRIRELGPASDQFSLGVMLYEVLAGRPPFHGDSLRELLNAIVDRDPVAPRAFQPRVHVDVETICLKAMEKVPTRRYPSVGAMAEDLTRYLEGESIAARPAPLLARAWRRCLKHPVRLAVGVVIVLAGAWIGWRDVREAAARRQLVEDSRRAEAEERDLRRRRAQPLYESAQRILEVSDILARQGELTKRREGLTEAIALLDQALAKDPEFAEAWFARARAHRYLGMREEALEDLARTIRLRETWSAPFIERITILVDRFLDLREPTIAIGDASGEMRLTFRDISADPRTRPLLTTMRADLDRVMALGVRPEEALYLQGAILTTTGRPEDSIASLSEAIRIFPYYADAYMKRAYPLLLLARADEALADADRALELWPAFFEALLYRGTIRMFRNEDKPARDDFVKAAALDPRRPEPHESLGVLLLLTGELEESIREFTLALERRESGKALCNRATACLGLGRLEEAARDLDRALELDPSDGTSLAQRAQVHLQRGELAAARRDLDRALTLTTDNPAIATMDANLRWMEGDVAGALRQCEEVMARHPRFSEVYALRGDLRISQGDLENGILDLQSYLAKDIGAPDELDTRRRMAGAWADLGARRAAAAQELRGAERDRALSSAVEAVRQALRQGHPQGARLREAPSFAPLLGLEEFEALFR